MSSTRYFTTKQVITSGSMTGTSVITGTEMDIQNAQIISVHATWTGTPSGTFAFQVTNEVSTGNVGANWFTIALSPALTNPSGSASTTAGQLTPLAFRKCRLIYTNSTSTGTLNAFVTVKSA